MDLQTFFESTTGQLISVGAIILFMVLIFLFAGKERKMSVKAVSLAAVLIAVAFVVNNLFPHIQLPYGGSATFFSMFFLFLIGYTFGPAVGITAGLAYGLLDLLINPYVVYPLQLLMDYPLAFGMMGLGGFFAKSKRMIPGYLLAMFGRFMMHFLSGIFFFAEYASPGQTVWAYSAGYQFSYLGPEAVATVLILLIPVVRNAIDRVVADYKRER